MTERQLAVRIAAVAADLTRLRDTGVRLAVDDFGTGYVSLDYLRRFSFDEIKIDRSFIAGLGQDMTDTARTSSIIALGRSMGLTVVAEGVETQTQHNALRKLGCDLTQGYLLQRPAPPDVISDLLRAPLCSRSPSASTWPSRQEVTESAEARPADAMCKVANQSGGRILTGGAGLG